MLRTLDIIEDLEARLRDELGSRELEGFRRALQRLATLDA
jgi:hypothetical protein